MTVSELREKLELIDGECEIVIHDGCSNLYEIMDMGLNPYFENVVDNDKTPYCIKVR